MIDWDHIAVQTLSLGGPIIFYLWKRGHTAKKEQDKRHKENQTVMRELVRQQDYIAPHDHKEEKGPLAAEGIRKAPPLRLPPGTVNGS